MKLFSLLLAIAAASSSLLAQDNTTPTGKTIPIHITVQNGQLVAPATIAAGPNDALEITVDNPRYAALQGIASDAPISTSSVSVTEYAAFNATSSLGVSLVGGYSCGHNFTSQGAPFTFSYHPNSNIKKGFLDALQINMDASDDDPFPRAHLSCSIVITPDTSAQ